MLSPLRNLGSKKEEPCKEDDKLKPIHPPKTVPPVKPCLKVPLVGPLPAALAAVQQGANQGVVTK